MAIKYRGAKFLLPFSEFNQKGGGKMNPGSYEKNIERIFDSYCKRIIKRKFLDYLREIKRRSNHEIVLLSYFFGMSDREISEALKID